MLVPNTKQETYFAHPVAIPCYQRHTWVKILSLAIVDKVAVADLRVELRLYTLDKTKL